MIVEKFVPLKHHESIYDSWQYKLATEVFNESNTPLNELTDRIEYVNNYKGVTMVKVLDTEGFSEERKPEDVKFHRDKHFSQFTSEEIKYLYWITDEILYSKGIDFTEHCIVRGANRGISYKQLLRALEGYQLVEFREVYDDYGTEMDCRLTVRSSFKYNLDKQCRFIYAVISLIKGSVTTVFTTNENKAKYERGDMIKRYNDKIDIKESILKAREMNLV